MEDGAEQRKAQEEYPKRVEYSLYVLIDPWTKTVEPYDGDCQIFTLRERTKFKEGVLYTEFKPEVLAPAFRMEGVGKVQGKAIVGCDMSVEDVRKLVTFVGQLDV